MESHKNKIHFYNISHFFSRFAVFLFRFNSNIYIEQKEDNGNREQEPLHALLPTQSARTLECNRSNFQLNVVCWKLQKKRVNVKTTQKPWLCRHAHTLQIKWAKSKRHGWFSIFNLFVCSKHFLLPCSFLFIARQFFLLWFVVFFSPLSQKKINCQLRFILLLTLYYSLNRMSGLWRNSRLSKKI